MPVAQSLVILKTGFLFVASEFANHALYQFLSIKSSDNSDLINVEVEIEGEAIVIPHFKPRALKNLFLVDDVDSLSPVLDAKVLDLAGEETPQIYCLCGRGPRSTLRTLRHGLAVAEMAVSELPSNPRYTRAAISTRIRQRACLGHPRSCWRDLTCSTHRSDLIHTSL